MDYSEPKFTIRKVQIPTVKQLSPKSCVFSRKNEYLASIRSWTTSKILTRGQQVLTGAEESSSVSVRILGFSLSMTVFALDSTTLRITYRART